LRQVIVQKRDLLVLLFGHLYSFLQYSHCLITGGP
jgi:hypothetical protein